MIDRQSSSAEPSQSSSIVMSRAIFSSMCLKAKKCYQTCWDVDVHIAPILAEIYLMHASLCSLLKRETERKAILNEGWLSQSSVYDKWPSMAYLLALFQVAPAFSTLIFNMLLGQLLIGPKITSQPKRVLQQDLYLKLACRLWPTLPELTGSS